MAVIDDLTTAKANLTARLLEVTASQQTDYSIDGQSVTRSQYQAMLTRQIAELNQLIQVEGGPFELRTVGAS